MIDVEELICELHHIAGTESVDAGIRRTACDAESALASLRAWVNELQMNFAEREAVAWAVQLAKYSLGQAERYDALSGLLERMGGGK